MTRAGLLGALLLSTLLGCATSPRAFVADQGLRITAPTPMAVVSAPFVVSWATTVPRASSYAVFIDQAPIPPGHTMRDLATTECKHQAGCPDAPYLAGRNVYVTTADQLVVPTMPVLGGTAGRVTHPTHTLTIVSLDANGQRHGDAAWTTEFRG
jgi:hypothetical protein